MMLAEIKEQSRDIIGYLWILTGINGNEQTLTQISGNERKLTEISGRGVLEGVLTYPGKNM